MPKSPSQRCARWCATTRARPACATERQIGAVLRNVAVRTAEGSAQQVRIEPDDLHAILARPSSTTKVAVRTCIPGVATGLA